MQTKENNEISLAKKILKLFQRLKRTAFTLAEVLIVLGIIGIVAAMTIPTLINAKNKQVTEIRLKKFYTVMNQAILLSENDNGSRMDWDFVMDSQDKEGNIIDQAESNNAFFDKYYSKYLKIQEKKLITNGDNHQVYLYIFADGSAFAFAYHESRDYDFFPQNPEKCLKHVQLERMGKCSFDFTFYPTNSGGYWRYLYKKGLESFIYAWNGKNESLYSDSTYGCKSGIYPTYCTAIIQHNGWKIPDDYPKSISY